MLTRFFDLAVIKRKLKFNKGATMEVVSDAGVSSTLNIAELAVLDGVTATAAEINRLASASTANNTTNKVAVLTTSGALALNKGLAMFGAPLTTAQLAAITTAAPAALTTTSVAALSTSAVAYLATSQLATLCVNNDLLVTSVLKAEQDLNSIRAALSAIGITAAS